MERKIIKIIFDPSRWRAKVVAVLSLALALSGGACFSGDEGESFYGRVVVPRAQEFRWSDGGLPRVFDPARAAAPPDTDAVRALYEGLTDYDPQTLAAVPAAAARWEASKDARVWTFYLREDARWSNGEPVTAQDYLRSWQRTLRLGDDAPHSSLLNNLLADADSGKHARTQTKTEGEQGAGENEATKESAAKQTREREANDKGASEREADAAEANGAKSDARAPRLAVEALGDHVLRLSLRRADPNLPALLAHPIFRPVHGSSAESDQREEPSSSSVSSQPSAKVSTTQLVTNGAFRLGETTDDRVVLERATNYWNASQVALERVRFVGARDAEAALGAYRAGEVDAVTNVNVEPTGLKLLASYKDFRRSTFGALTYYDFNATRPPFDDVRVRLALALALDRKRLSEDTLEGSTVPAEKFLPGASHDEKSEGVRARNQSNGESKKGEAVNNEALKGGAKEETSDAEAAKSEDGQSLTFDPTRARRLLAEAGYPGGDAFPHVRLLVNRNDQHRQVAETVAEMWRATLGVETDIELKNWDEYETRLRAGEYDVAKRSVLMQTTDEEANMLAMFAPDRFAFGAGVASGDTKSGQNTTATPTSSAARRNIESAPPRLAPEILSESRALKDVPAIPVYFASSFALVKPYVEGFDANLLEAYSLQRVRVNTGWQPPQKEASAVVGWARK